jgi:hypothetical protein
MKALAVALGMLVGVSLSNVARGQAPAPGLRAMAQASTDIVVVEVLESKPRKAPGGARGTAKVKVLRTLKGPLKPDDEIGVYHGLFWEDLETHSLEKPKFEVGKRATVFLVNSMGYTLTDHWLAVLPEHRHLESDVAFALNFVEDQEWSNHWRKQQVGPIPARVRIEILPDDKAVRSKAGVILPVKITNHSSREIAIRLPHDSHGDPPVITDLFASVWHVQDKAGQPFEPIFRNGKQLRESEPIRIPPGKSVTVELRLDAPGIGSRPGKPVFFDEEREGYVRLLLAFESGLTTRQYATSATKRVQVVEK